jgi:hypothetical protein
MSIFVGQQLVRFVIEQYRDELLRIIHGTLDERQVAEAREAVASDLLNILHRYIRRVLILFPLD